MVLARQINAFNLDTRLLRVNTKVVGFILEDNSFYSQYIFVILDD